MKEGIILYQGSFRDRDERAITVKIKKVGYEITAKVTHLDISAATNSWRLSDLITSSGPIVFESNNSSITYDERTKIITCDYNSFSWVINMEMTFTLQNNPDKKVTITVTQAAAEHNIFVEPTYLEYGSNGYWKPIRVWSDTGDPYFTDPYVDWIFTMGVKSWQTSEIGGFGFDGWVYCQPNHSGDARETTITAKLDGHSSSVASKIIEINQVSSNENNWIDTRFTKQYSGGGTYTIYGIPLMRCDTRNSVTLSVATVPAGSDYTKLMVELVDIGDGTDWVTITGPTFVVDGSVRMPGFNVRFDQFDTFANNKRFMIMRVKDSDSGVYDEIMLQQTSI